MLNKDTKLLDPEKNSFVIVRNPYMRLLSGFNHWVRTKQLYGNYSDDFDGFIGLLEKSKSWNNINVHFIPQSKHCNLNNVQLDLELKIEQVYSWFSCLPTIFGDSGNILCQGWERKTGRFYDGDFLMDPCKNKFNSNPNMVKLKEILGFQRLYFLWLLCFFFLRSISLQFLFCSFCI